MKILLVKLREPVINAPVVPSLGLWNLRSTAKIADPDSIVEICDEQKGHKLEDFLKEEHWDIIGISAMFAIQYFQFIRTIALAKESGAKVIVGGILGYQLAPKFLNLIDDYCIGEGENWLSSKFFGKRVKNLDDIPIPCFTEEEIKSYWIHHKPFGGKSATERWIPLETSRGCPRSCDFCIVPYYWGEWRAYSIERMREKFEYLKKKDIQEVFISDDNMSSSKNHFLKLMELFKEYGFYWSTPNGFSAKTLIDDECFKAITKTNCWQIQIAFDATTQKSADLIDMKSKFVEYEDAYKISIKLKEAGIKSVGFFIIGYPGQTIEDIKNTLDFANSLPLDNRHIHIATPYPGTTLFNNCVKNGWLTCKPEEIYSKFVNNKSYQISVIKTSEFTPEEVMRIRAEDREKALERKKNER